MTICSQNKLRQKRVYRTVLYKTQKSNQEWNCLKRAIHENVKDNTKMDKNRRLLIQTKFKKKKTNIMIRCLIKTTLRTKNIFDIDKAKYYQQISLKKIEQSRIDKKKAKDKS